MVSALSRQALSVSVPSIHAPSILTSLIKEPLAPGQEPPISVPLAPFSSVKSDGKEPKKLPEQVNIFSIYAAGNKDIRQSKYPISRKEKVVGQVVDPEKFVTSIKDITLEKFQAINKKVIPPYKIIMTKIEILY